MAHQYNYIYILTNKISGRKYIGKHSTNNLQDGYFGSGFIIRQIKQKYGKDIFTKEIIEFCTNEQQAYQRQKYWIQYYNAIQNEDFYNLDQGGKGRSNYSVSKETRLKMSKSQQRRLKNKKNHPMYGKNHSEQTKQKIGQSHLGKKASQETKKKLSAVKSGENNPRAIKVECLNNNRIFNTIKEAAQWAGVDNSTLSQHLKGRTKTCGFDPDQPFLKIRLKWRYVKEL